MSEDPKTYSPQEITHFLTVGFAAPLIISTIAFMILGVNICQFSFYFQNLARRDHLLTRVWVCVVAILTLLGTGYEVYVNWLYSVSDFTVADTPTASITTGNIFTIYSTVITLVQMFWLSCIKKLLFTKPRLAWYIIVPLALASLSSFGLSIAIAVISRLRPGPWGSWPTAEISILVRCALGLYLGVDLSILIVIISQLVVLKKSSGDLKTTITKLSWILCLLTFISTVMVVTELSIDVPQSGSFVGPVPIVISFAPIIPTVYLGSFLAVLNAREDLFSEKRRSQRRSEDTSSRGLIPGLRFTVDLPDSRTVIQSREASASEPVMTFISTRRRSGEREATS